MSSTIYGGKTRNGVIIQDMVDDNRDYVYRNKNFEGYFARFAQSLLDENDVTITDTEPTDTEGHCIDGEAVYKGEKFFFHDSIYSDSTSWEQGAAIDLVRSKLLQTA